MKTAMFQAMLFLGLSAASSSGSNLSPPIQLPVSLSGAPGDVVGWGFSSTNDDFFQSISFGQSILINETNPSLGTYMDMIGPQGGPDNFAVDPGETWSQGFSILSQQGLGSFTIDPGATPGASDFRIKSACSSTMPIARPEASTSPSLYWSPGE